MRALWRGLGRVFFWSYERMTWQYDVMVALILAFLFLTPRHWFHDQPRAAVTVQVVSQHAGDRLRTYRLEATALASNRRALTVTPAMRRRAHELLSRSVRDLQGSPFEVIRVDPKLTRDGSVAYYEVTIEH